MLSRENSFEVKRTRKLMDGESIYRNIFGEGAQPDVWQQKLMANEWPEVLIAPTGSGKTAAVTLGWAAHRLRAPESTPRRLIWCLPMRTLVEQTARAVNEWFDKLNQVGADGDNVLPLPDEDVHLLMGGVQSARWLYHPERPAVIIGTQDMLLSRALMRGYASSRAIWPMEFALLHEDTQWVFDEVQLMSAGRATSAQLEAFRRSEAARANQNNLPTNHPARSLWISATLDPKWLQTVNYSPPTRNLGESEPRKKEDRLWEIAPRPEDDRLWRLSTAKKSLSCADAVPLTGKSQDIAIYIQNLAELLIDAHQTGRMTLAIVNRVERAQALYEAIVKKSANQGEAAPEIALVHARFRSADRKREMKKILANRNEIREGSKDLIVISTQAVEAGVDISAAVLFTEIAPWASMVQRFGRANRYAELESGADVRWIDLIDGKEDKEAVVLALPYTVEDLKSARQHLTKLHDVAPSLLPSPDDVHLPRRVIRRKDIYDLFDTDPDLTGFDVDVSHYIRDAADTDLHVFWRDISSIGEQPPRPQQEELCAVPIGAAREWLRKVRKHSKDCIFVRDPQWRREDKQRGNVPPGWKRLSEDPWPGLTLLVDIAAGGYKETLGFTGRPANLPCPISMETEDRRVAGSEAETSISANAQRRQPSETTGEADGYDEDPNSEIDAPVSLGAHLEHVVEEANKLCNALNVEPKTRDAIIRAARWHDLGKSHEVFQQTMQKGLKSNEVPNDRLLAKTTGKNLHHKRRYFRHEVASALALLTHEKWKREADLVAYLVAAHHGKVRMNLRALPREHPPPKDRIGARFARGVWENDELPPLDVGNGELWEGGSLTLSIMELGWDELTHESWTERMRDLLTQFGPFRLAWLETLVRIADWRASGKEQKRCYDDT